MAGIKNAWSTATAALVLFALPAIVSTLQVVQRLSPAVAIPRPLVDKPIALEAGKVEQQEDDTFACDVGAYVRAPDLYPGQKAYGEARLIANGSACDQLLSRDIVLRMRKRSVVKLPKPDIKVPARPVYNSTEEDAYYANRTSASGALSWRNIIAQGHEVFSSLDRNLSLYDKAMEEYGESCVQGPPEQHVTVVTFLRQITDKRLTISLWASVPQTRS